MKRTGWTRSGSCRCLRTFKRHWKTRNGTRLSTPASVAASPRLRLASTSRPVLWRRYVSRGVETAFVTLHVGWATFRPVQVEDITSHDMHAEFYRIDETSADAINRAKCEGRRVIAVGTTTVRLLEYAATLEGGGASDTISAGSGWADIFIYPGYTFRVVDTLVTNFHLPESTLLMLVSAFADRELMLAAYREAVDRRYRFYSFGDAMLIL